VRSARSLVVVGTMLVGCGDGVPDKNTPPPPDGRRSEVIAGNTAVPQKTAPATTGSAEAKPPREICQTPPAAAGKPIPRGELAKVVATGSKGLPDVIDVESVWTWVNLWAGWCGPCKEEMPLLAEWGKKLRAEGTPMHVAFVSIDDDERQAMRFLESQAAVKESFRLPEGAPRQKWLDQLSLPTAPELPVHLLFDPKGALRCVVTGAIRESDFPKVKSIVSAK
jgi:thiol-disulfide isomerase/thioredoxin